MAVLTAPTAASRWIAAWQAVGAQRIDPALRESLLARWNEPARHYHTARHLGECLQHFAAVRAEAEHPAEVELALWFHDAVYDLQARDNEARSADWARSAALAAGAPPPVTERLHALVMATRHSTLPVSHDEALLVDVDLSILGAETGRFDEYERQVRAEYAWVPEAIYREKRAAVLQGFLDRPRLFTTRHFFDRLEVPARRNLADSIRRLAA